MEFRHLRSFVAVAEALSFRRAAEGLHLAQPALSAQIQQLEEDVGTRLLERDSHHVALTAAGQEFLEHSRRMLRAAEEARHAAGRAARGETGRRSIGFIAQLSYEWLPKVLRVYHRRFPKVELTLTEMSPAQQVDELLARRLDLGICGVGLPEPHEELERTVLSEEDLVAALPWNHPLARQKTLSLAALSGEGFIFSGPTYAPSLAAWFIGLCRQAGFEPRIVREADRAPSTLNYVAAGFGVSIFPAQIGRLKTPGVRFIPLEMNGVRYPLGAVWHREGLTPALGQFLRAAGRVVGAGGGGSKSPTPQTPDPDGPAAQTPAPVNPDE